MNMNQHTLDVLTKMKNSFDYHIDRIDPTENEFMRGLSGGLRLGKMYVQQLLDDYWQVTVKKMLR